MPNHVDDALVELVELLSSIEPAPKVKGCWHCSRNVDHCHEANGDKVVF